MIGEAPALSELLASWPERFHAALLDRMMKRLGIDRRGEADDRPMVSAVIEALRSRVVGIDRFFFDWRGGRIPTDEVYQAGEFDGLRALLEGRQRPLTHIYWSDVSPCSMLIDEVEAIWAAISEHDDWTPFESKIETIRRLGDAMTADAPG